MRLNLKCLCLKTFPKIITKLCWTNFIYKTRWQTKCYERNYFEVSSEQTSQTYKAQTSCWYLFQQLTLTRKILLQPFPNKVLLEKVFFNPGEKFNKNKFHSHWKQTRQHLAASCLPLAQRFTVQEKQPKNSVRQQQQQHTILSFKNQGNGRQLRRFFWWNAIKPWSVYFHQDSWLLSGMNWWKNWKENEFEKAWENL